MSNSYIDSLDWQARKRYREKLEAVGLSLEDEPYSANDRFRSDMTLWPRIEYGYIFAYFIVRPVHTPSSNFFPGSRWRHTTILSPAM